MTIKKIFRKSLWFQLILASIVGILIYNAFTYAEDAETWIPDANLRQAVREALGLPADAPLTKEKMQELGFLPANDRGIVDITGLEFATNLRKLFVGKNPITDLRPLANLTQLVEFHFWHVLPNPINLDLRPLASLINLEVLSLKGHGISDISPLAGLKKLQRLHLSNNQIEDISPLQGLMNLTHLGLGGTNISDSDLSSLSALTSLRYLDLWGNQISDLSPISALTSLIALDLPDNQISNLSPLSALTDLRKLSLINNPLSDLRPLSNLVNLEVLELAYCKVSDVSPLAGLVNLRVLTMHHNLTRDFTPLAGLTNLTDFDYGGICEIAPLPPPVTERIANKTFPSIALPSHSLYNTEPLRRLTHWDDPDIYYDVATQHDMHHYSRRFGLGWQLTLTEPTAGLATRLSGNPEAVMEEYQKYAERNPNMLFIPAIGIGIYGGLDALPPDSDFWLRDADGQVIENEGAPWGEYTLDILNPEVQQLVIERVVGIAECGYFHGVMFDTWVPYHQYFYEKHFGIGDEEVIQAYITTLKGIRARVRDDFLILVNRNERKSPRYAEWINGSHMEMDSDILHGYSYEKLIEIEDALSWNEKHLREPRINVLHGEGVIHQPADGPDNLRWMRVFTTLSLTHSDGYCIFKAVPIKPNGGHIWYDFWNADLGRPVGGAETKGQLYDNREGLFIREFDNGWAVYNRSGGEQTITLPRSEGVASGVIGTEHVLADLDGEIYLKSESGVETSPTADINEDGVVNIQDLVIVANALGEAEPDLNGDGVVNILDLVIVANAF